MHLELDPLLKHAARLATKKLREDREVPIFAAYLDAELTPTYLNLIVEPEYELPRSTAGLVEFVRAQLRHVDPVAAVFCAPVEMHMSDGSVYQGIKIHLDHRKDPTAHTITLPYRFAADGMLLTFKYVHEESDDLIFPR